MSSIISKLINLGNGLVIGTLAVANGGTGVTTSTGTVAAVLSTSPTLVTPNIGVATATDLTFSSTTKGISGTTTNNSVDAGYVGEYMEGQVTSLTAITAGSNTYQVVTNVPLTAGDWDVEALVYIEAGTAVTAADIFIGTTNDSATTGRLTYANQSVIYPTAVAGGITATIPRYRVSISSPTTQYLKVRATFSVAPTFEGRISARRMR